MTSKIEQTANTVNSEIAHERLLLNQMALDRMTAVIVKVLAEHYAFSAVEALALLGSTPKTTTPAEKPKKRAPIPWLGVARGGDMCQALDYKGGLFTQCDARAKPNCQWCAKCDKHGQKYGTVAQRVAQGEAFTDAKGRTPSCYAAILASSGFTREDAESEASARGVTLPESVFAPRPKAKRASKKQTPAPVITEPTINDVLDAALDEPEPVPVVVPVVAPTPISAPLPAPVVAPVPVSVPVATPAEKKPRSTTKKAAAVAPVDPRKPVPWEFRGTAYGKNAENEVFAAVDGKFAEAALGTYDPLVQDIKFYNTEEDEDNEEDE